jgi:acyl-CoA thioester hydrolase
MSTPAPISGQAVHRIEVAVRWGDLDAFGHANNTCFHRYIEEARVLWFRALSTDWANEAAAPILAAATVNYRRPIGWPETVVVELTAERVGGKSVTLGHRLSSATQADVLYADGTTVLVWVDRNGATLTLPDAVRAACAG